MSLFAGYGGAGFNWSTTGPCPSHLRTFDEKGNRIATLEPVPGVPGGVIAVPYYGEGSGLHPAKQSTDVTENLARVSRISEPRGATAVELEAEVKRRSIVEKIVHKKND